MNHHPSLLLLIVVKLFKLTRSNYFLISTSLKLNSKSREGLRKLYSATLR